MKKINLKTLAIIPARSGSKRIPKKNIKIFHGSPIIGWSIKNAIKSNVFDKIIVSTDSEEIANISRKYGAEVPFLRPKKLSDDFTTTTDVVKHSIDWFTERNFLLNYVCCIYPASPLIKWENILNCYEILVKKKKYSFVFPVTKLNRPVYRSFTIDRFNKIKMLFPQHYKTRSQDTKDVFHDAGQFYWGTKQAWISEKMILDKYSYPYIIPNNEVVDIDTQSDWKKASELFESLNTFKK